MRLALSLFLLAALAACATSEPEAQRSSVGVPAELASIDRTLLAGRWSCEEINPLPDAPAFTQTTRFDPNGKATQEAIATSEAQDGSAPMRLNLRSTYDWSTQGGRLIASNVQTEVTPGNNEGMSAWMAGVTQMVADAFGASNEPGAYSVRELTSSRLVMQAADVEDPAILGCTRRS